jgi:hypothetical protein
MADSIREQIIQAIETKLEDILTTNGYHSDCGANVQRVRKQFDPDELPAIAIWPKPEESKYEYGSCFNTMPVQIEAIVLHGTTNPSIVSEKLLADLLECIQGVEWTVSFTSGGTYEVEAGDTITGATSAATGYVTGVSLTGGAWGSGTAAGTFTLRRLSGTFVAENLDVGANTNEATIAAAPSGSNPVTTTTSGLAEKIIYETGGTNEYPDAGEQVTGVQTIFQVTYPIVVGNPYAQP